MTTRASAERKMRLWANLVIVLILGTDLFIAFNRRSLDHDLGSFPFSQTPMYSELRKLSGDRYTEPWVSSRYVVEVEGKVPDASPRYKSISPGRNITYRSTDPKLVSSYLNYTYFNTAQHTGYRDSDYFKSELKRIKIDLQRNWGYEVAGLRLEHRLVSVPPPPAEVEVRILFQGLLARLDGDTFLTVEASLDGRLLRVEAPGYKNPTLAAYLAPGPGEPVRLPDKWVAPGLLELPALPPGRYVLYVNVEQDGVSDRYLLRPLTVSQDGRYALEDS